MKKHFVLSLGLLAVIGCGPKIKPIVATPLENHFEPSISKKIPLGPDDMKHWNNMSLPSDTIPGLSSQKAYELMAGLPSETVIVAVVDSGTDINHEDLKDVIWTNKDEVAGNNIDDDNNGYIDDIHGWNFLGKISAENLEMTRIVKKGAENNPDYVEAKKSFDKKNQETKMSYERVGIIAKKLETLDSLMLVETGKKEYEIEDFTPIVQNHKNPDIKSLSQFTLFGIPISQLKKEIKGAISHYKNILDYGLNLEFNGRKVVGDNPDDFSDTKYGNNNVIGPVLKDAFHGTHCSGIIAAKHNNIGMSGVATNVKIMPVRAVPDGDEYDKDIALAFRYAVDNGAKVINASFGKAFSPHANKVKEAIKYAASKDVLIVQAAGNDSQDIDIEPNFPTDATNGAEISDNLITVGALSPTYGEGFTAIFSNYGKKNVDIFAPGENIWSTISDNAYDFASGTSMAAPSVSGVAALIRSYYPRLTASQVKKIIMKSGLSYTGITTIGATKKDFSKFSKSGKIANAYNALILANQVARRKVKLSSPK